MPTRGKQKGKKTGKDKQQKGAAAAAGRPESLPPPAPPSAAVVAAAAAAERLGDRVRGNTVTPQDIAAAAAAVAGLGSPTAGTAHVFCAAAHGIASALDHVRREEETCAWSARAADAAARFPDALPPDASAAFHFEVHASHLSGQGRVADAAAWVARAHPMRLRGSSVVGLRQHLRRACILRFHAGHAAKAI
eukprot:gene8168-1888_t